MRFTDYLLQVTRPMGRRRHPCEMGTVLKSHPHSGTVSAFALPIYMNGHKRIIRHLISTLFMIGFTMSLLAQEVLIPDPGLNAAIRQALQKPNGPLTEQDLLSLTALNATSRGVSSVEGL